jgi:predicted transcriptional regulator
MASAEAEALDRTFRALGDPTRRSIWELLGERPGATTAELVAESGPLSRWAVMKHLETLRGAGLVQTLPRGRERCHFRVEDGLDAARAWLAGESAGPGRPSGRDT